MKVDLYGDPRSENVFIQAVDDHDAELMNSEIKEIERLCGHKDWCVAAVSIENWNRDLTPWRAEPVFGKEGFGDGANDTLTQILDRVIPALSGDGAVTRRYYLCGYSLAGLFSLWSAFQTDVFSGIVAASPSVWYRDWIIYAEQNRVKTPRVYLSLGDKEEKAKNPVMATVGDAVKKQYQLLKDGGVQCCLEWNPGNHFVNSDLRMAKGIAWMLSSAAVNQMTGEDGESMKLFAKKYKVDYCGKKFAYLGAKDEYRAGEKVTLVFHMVATDTDYWFSLDGGQLTRDYDPSKGFILSFTMPENDVVLHCSSRNTMLIEEFRPHSAEEELAPCRTADET